jgi:N utilization substance protein B
MIDKRHALRIKTVQELYALSFNPSSKLSSLSQEVLNNKDIIDPYIKRSAPKYDVDLIAHVDLAILRLAVYELVIKKTEPPKVIINEAIEVAHELAGDTSPSFVNAVLGSIYREILPLPDTQ